MERNQKALAYLGGQMGQMPQALTLQGRLHKPPPAACRPAFFFKGREAGSSAGFCPFKKSLLPMEEGRPGTLLERQQEATSPAATQRWTGLPPTSFIGEEDGAP